MMRERIVSYAAGLAVGSATSFAWAGAPPGTAFTYQGQLKSGGIPVTDSADFRFSLWNAESAGDWHDPVIATPGIPLNNGLFTVELDFGTRAVSGAYRWLQIDVRSPAWDGVGPEPEFIVLEPRQKITAAPYALALPGLWTQQNATSPNLIGGWQNNTVDDGVVGATISGGGDPTDVTPPSFNRVTDNLGTVGGGSGNAAGDYDDDVTSAPGATVGGGHHNHADGEAATVGGGSHNLAGHTHATVAGGSGNLAEGDSSAIGGGYGNEAPGTHAHIGGGRSNAAFGAYSTVCGGRQNAASGTGAVVGGGGTVPDGAGGFEVAENLAVGHASTIPGGWGNWAFSDYSFAAGRRAATFHPGAFVWADAAGAPGSLDQFDSTGPNQFLIRASGGVGIGKNDPTEQLDVSGNIRASGQLQTGSLTIDGTTNTIHSSGDLHLDANGRTLIHMINSSRRVGIGTSDPKRDLHVAGDYYGLGHVFLYAYEGDGQSGTAYLQARDFSGSSSIDLRLRTQSAGAVVDTMTLTADGEVGIGTDTPGEKLHVVGGNVKVDNANGWRVATVGEASPNGTGMAVRLAVPGIPPNPPEPRNADICYDGTRLSLLTGISNPPAETNGLIIDNLGRVGIGTTDPDNKLHVNGGAQAHRFKFDIPKTHFYSIGPADFQPTEDVAYALLEVTTPGVRADGFDYIDVTPVVAPVHLPHGATVTSFTGFVHDANGAVDHYASVSLTRIDLATGATSGLAHVSSTEDVVGYQSATDSSILNPVIDNQGYAYFVRGRGIDESCWDPPCCTIPNCPSPLPWPDGIEIMGASIEFTTTEAD